jgi:hypothetical protein
MTIMSMISGILELTAMHDSVQDKAAFERRIDGNVFQMIRVAAVNTVYWQTITMSKLRCTTER